MQKEMWNAKGMYASLMYKDMGTMYTAEQLGKAGSDCREIPLSCPKKARIKKAVLLAQEGVLLENLYATG
jgi:hypothetical protein